MIRTKVSPRRNGAANRLQAEDRPVHEWFRFVLSYPPHHLRGVFMENTNEKRPDSRRRRLLCKCGNSERFLEIMAFESHIVNGNLDYLHLDQAITGEYRCCHCGEVVRTRLA